MNLTRLFIEFFESEKAGGFILIFATAFSLALANSPLQTDYFAFWQSEVGGHTMTQWINDGLMAIFFLLIGLELEREIYCGELSDIRKASLPVFGAIGGMIIPAAIYLLLNFGTKGQSGFGIPMATDIAFSIGILSLLGKGIPASIKVFLIALAVIDDLGAIIIIAIFYTGSLSVANLLIAFGIYLILIILNRLKVRNLIPYLAGGVAMWYFMEYSGVHATITGVFMAFVIPFGDGKEKSPSYQLQHYLHKPVAFVILPLFALANTCLTIDSSVTAGLTEKYSLGIIAGLIIGKPLGILLFGFTATRLQLSVLPPELRWKTIFGAGLLGGVGFTMSIFIAMLAFNDPVMINISKMAILIASLVAGTSGFLWLKVTLRPGVAN